MTRHLLRQGTWGSGGRYGAYLVSNQSESRAFQATIVLNRTLPCTRPFRLRTITTVHITWLELNSRNFPPPPLLPACALIIYFLSLYRPIWWRFFSTPLLKRYLCIVYWQILRIKFVTFSIAKFTPTKFESVFDYETLQKTSTPPRTALGRAKEHHLMSNDSV